MNIDKASLIYLFVSSRLRIFMALSFNVQPRNRDDRHKHVLHFLLHVFSIPSSILCLQERSLTSNPQIVVHIQLQGLREVNIDKRVHHSLVSKPATVPNQDPIQQTHF
jgi:hypothetical protein